MKKPETLDLATLRWAVDYLKSWRDAKASYPDRVSAFVAGCDELLVHLEAAAERVARGERAELLDTCQRHTPIDPRICCPEGVRYERETGAHPNDHPGECLDVKKRRTQ